MSKDNGGPAFPAKNFIVPADLEARHVHALGVTQGMTLRDYFAAKALQGMLAKSYDDESSRKVWEDSDTAARWAYEFADAMLAERAK